MTEAQSPAATESLPALLPPAARAAQALQSTQTEHDLRVLVASSADITAVLDDDGRDQVHRIAMNLRTARTTIEKTGKAARDDATKFSKAVIEEEKRLIAIITPEEERVLALRDAWDAEQARIQAEKVAAERRRTEAHEAGIAEILRIPANASGFDAEKIMRTIDSIDAARAAPFDVWEEFAERAAAAYDETVAALRAMHATKLATEEKARQDAADREAERQRIAAEQAELARQREEQAAAARQLADQVEAMRAQQAAMERAAREAAAEQKRQADAMAAEMKRQQEEFAEQRAAFAREQLAMREAKEAAAELERAHAEALEMDSLIDAFVAAHEQPITTQEEAEAIYETAIAAEEVQPPAALLDLPDDEPDEAAVIAAVAQAFDLTAEDALALILRVAAPHIGEVAA